MTYKYIYILLEPCAVQENVLNSKLSVPWRFIVCSWSLIKSMYIQYTIYEDWYTHGIHWTVLFFSSCLYTQFQSLCITKLSNAHLWGGIKHVYLFPYQTKRGRCSPFIDDFSLREIDEMNGTFYRSSSQKAKIQRLRSYCTALVYVSWGQLYYAIYSCIYATSFG